jgi:hypothetical protein
MSWADDVQRANQAFLGAWGASATLQPQGGGPAVAFTGIVKNPGIEEQFQPGGSPGTTVLRFWVDFSNMATKPAVGDTVTVNGTVYDMGRPPEVDVEGGAVLHLRARHA